MGGVTREVRETAVLTVRSLVYNGIKQVAKGIQADRHRQSKTLPQAVIEYRKRYGRNPPKGFESWWKFARQNNIKIVDDVRQPLIPMISDFQAC